jgi:hypothetical protein
MATEKDHALIAAILRGTKTGVISWEPTAEPDQFAATFKGKYIVTVDKGRNDSYWLKMTDKNEATMLKVTSEESFDVRDVYLEAQRKSLNVDDAIDEIIKDIDDEIPF